MKRNSTSHSLGCSYPNLTIKKAFTNTRLGKLSVREERNLPNMKL